MDHAALPALIEAMEAAGFHDHTRAVAALDQAEDALPRGFHQSREAIETARACAHASDWAGCWAHAIRATNTLTGPVPPDPATLPAKPDLDAPFTRDATCGCGTVLPVGARFCPTCGTPTR